MPLCSIGHSLEMVNSTRYFNYVLLSLLLYDSTVFSNVTQPQQVLVLYPGGQMSLRNLLQMINGTSCDARMIDENVQSTAIPVVTFGDAMVMFFDLEASSIDEEATLAVAVLIQNIFNQRTLLQNVSIVGPSCSASAYAVAQLIKRSGISVRHFHTAPLPAPLAAEVSGTSVGLLPPVDLLAETSVALIKHADWSQVLVIYQETDIDMRYTFIKFQSLLTELDKMNEANSKATDGCGIESSTHTLAASIIVSHNDFSQVKDHLMTVLNTSAIRVIFVMLNAREAQQLLCKMKNYKFPDYQWVILKTTLKEIIPKADGVENIPCSSQVLMEVLHNAVFIGYSIPEKYQPIESNNLLEYLYELAIYFALEKNNVCKNSNKTQILNHYESFLSVVQFVSTTKYDKIQSFSSLSLISSDFPSESQLVENIMTTVMFLFSGALLLITMSLHILTFHYRKTKSIRATSYNVQHLAFSGVYLLLLDTAIYIFFSFYDLKSLQIHFCNIYWVLLSLSLTILTAVLAVHSWRLYRIFSCYTDPGRMLTDKHLVLIILCLASLNVILLTLWAIKSPEGYKPPCEIDYEKRIKLVSEKCYYDYYFYILFCGFLCYIFTILGTAVVLTFLTKTSVPKQQKNFRRNHIICITYCYAFIIFVGFPVFKVMHITNDITFTFITASCIHFGLVILPMLLLFAAPLYHVWKEINGDSVSNWNDSSVDTAS